MVLGHRTVFNATLGATSKLILYLLVLLQALSSFLNAQLLIVQYTGSTGNL